MVMVFMGRSCALDSIGAAMGTANIAAARSSWDFMMGSSWLQQFPFGNGALIPFRGEVAGEQIRVDALNEPFEEFVICEHAFDSEWILLEIGHRFLSAERAVHKKPSLFVREGTCQGQFASTLKSPIMVPMRRANGRESRFVGVIFRVVREQPNLRIFATGLI